MVVVVVVVVGWEGEHVYLPDWVCRADLYSQHDNLLMSFPIW